MNKPFFYIANWKMYFTYNQTTRWLNNYGSHLAQLAKDNQIIICPSFLALEYTTQQFYGSNISHILLGAQDCSPYASGAHTGQISAESLAEIGCNYCIIGHSEQRLFFDNAAIEQKALRLLEQHIIPILCIETPSPEQLMPAVSAFEQFPKKELLITYEPPSAIGTGTIPTNQQIEEIFNKITTFINENTPNMHYYLLYGGSVNRENVQQLKIIDHLAGFLIGKASTQFDEFKYIIES